MSGTLKECKLCRKLFPSTAGAGKVCADCTKYLDDIYKPVRSFIRDHKNPRELEVTEIADELAIPVRFVQGLVDQGYLGRDLPNAATSDDSADSDKKDRLAAELNKAADQLKARASQKAVTYGQERYSTGKK